MEPKFCLVFMGRLIFILIFSLYRYLRHQLESYIQKRSINWQCHQNHGFSTNHLRISSHGQVFFVTPLKLLKRLENWSMRIPPQISEGVSYPYPPFPNHGWMLNVVFSIEILT